MFQGEWVRHGFSMFGKERCNLPDTALQNHSAVSGLLAKAVILWMMTAVTLLLFLSIGWSFSFGNGVADIFTVSDTYGQMTAVPDTTQLYRVRPGDSLWKISERQLGDPLLWQRIFEWNSARIEDPDYLRPGQLLLLFPDIGQGLAGISESTLEGWRSVDGLPDTLLKIIHHQIGALSGIFSRGYATGSTAERVPQTEPGEASHANPQLAFNQMLIDVTQTPLGRDFYDRFQRQWEAPESIGNLYIEITERPVPGMGSMMIITVNNEMIYQFRLTPGYDRIMEMADAAAKGLQYYISNRSRQRSYF